MKRKSETSVNKPITQTPKYQYTKSTLTAVTTTIPTLFLFIIVKINYYLCNSYIEPVKFPIIKYISNGILTKRIL